MISDCVLSARVEAMDRSGLSKQRAKKEGMSRAQNESEKESNPGSRH